MRWRWYSYCMLYLLVTNEQGWEGLQFQPVPGPQVGLIKMYGPVFVVNFVMPEVDSLRIGRCYKVTPQ